MLYAIGEIEHLFTSVGGELDRIPDLYQTEYATNDAGAMLILLAAGLSPDAEEREIAAAMIRLFISRCDRASLIGVLRVSLLAADRQIEPARRE